MKLIYTNYGILTEERIRELKECGYGVDECGMAGEMGGAPLRMGHGYHDMDAEEPVRVVILGPGQEDVLEEGGPAGPEGSPGSAGNQIANVGSQGVAGSAAYPGGANVPDSTKRESFNRRAEALLEAWLEEEVKEELKGDQNELDVAPPFGKLTGADFRNLGKKSKHEKEKHEED